MPTPPTIRPLAPGDVAAADLIAWAALCHHIPVRHHPDDERLRAQRGRMRIAHLRATDPAGAWVAARDGELLGVALALVREGVWGLSLLAVSPQHQGQGIGGRLLSAALSTSRGASGAIILSSTDPRAMRRYHRAGFALRPCVAAGGQINRSRLPAGLAARAGDPEGDLRTLNACSRHVRGAAHGPDVAAMLAAGCELLVIDGRGFAIHREGSPVLLAALDDDAATDLLWSCLAAGPAGATVHADFIAAGNDWAITVALDAGLELEPDSPQFVRGTLGRLAPYLPSGAYL